jgi:hypothetical protein
VFVEFAHDFDFRDFEAPGEEGEGAVFFAVGFKEIGDFEDVGG